ncbi:MAG: hypothetical protein JWM30_1829 [Burkholderia sp.]|nr:hypothetical protein [Burkholderia sp.]
MDIVYIGAIAMSLLVCWAFVAGLRKSGRKTMTLFYVIGAFVSAGLLVYLLLALLHAEDL